MLDHAERGVRAPPVRISPPFIDAADTNGDEVIGAGDTRDCAPSGSSTTSTAPSTRRRRGASFPAYRRTPRTRRSHRSTCGRRRSARGRRGVRSRETGRRRGSRACRESTQNEQGNRRVRKGRLEVPPAHALDGPSKNVAETEPRRAAVFTCVVAERQIGSSVGQDPSPTYSKIRTAGPTRGARGVHV